LFHTQRSADVFCFCSLFVCVVIFLLLHFVDYFCVSALKQYSSIANLPKIENRRENGPIFYFSFYLYNY